MNPITIPPHVVRADMHGTRFDLRADFSNVPRNCRRSAYKASWAWLVAAFGKALLPATTGQGYCTLINADQLPESFVAEDMGEPRTMTKAEYLALCAVDNAPAGKRG